MTTVGRSQELDVRTCRELLARGAVGRVAMCTTDGPQILLDAGITAIVQPGGSVRDPEVIAAVEAAGASMYVTGVRHFFH